MFEVEGDLWTWNEIVDPDARCVTTNGYVKPDGRGVMGRGCAREATLLYPGISTLLGRHIQRHGNVVGVIWRSPTIYAFPVKHHWREMADMDLIVQSAVALMDEINATGMECVLLPRPGCGNGGLRWEDVKPVLEPILDGRVFVISR